MSKTQGVCVTTTDTHIVITITEPISIALPRGLGQLLVVFLRCIKDSSGVCVLTFEQISLSLGHRGRQWSQNIIKAWDDAQCDLYLFLEDKRKISQELLLFVSQYVMLYPLRSVLEQHREFIKAYPDKEMCINAFRDLVSAIDCSKFITAMRAQLTGGLLHPNSDYFLAVLLNKQPVVSNEYKAYIADLFATVAMPQKLEDKDIDWSQAQTQIKLVISLLYIYGVSQERLSVLFGLSKTTIHNYVVSFCDAGLEGFIIRMIGRWSGKISVDEKWIKIAGQWQYIFSAVDSVSGVPLLVKRFETADTGNWVLFLSQFKSYYGNPTLITSDGSAPLLAGLKIVFARVRHQLCWFHKMKNLYKRIYDNITDITLKTQMFKLAKSMFGRKNVSSRKQAARELYQIGGEKIQKYMNKSIFGAWRKLTLCMTNNAAERFNRKIEQCMACRYGIKNEACAHVLIRGLWFSELLTKGKVHWVKDASLENIDLPKIVKEHLDPTRIIHFLQNDKVQSYANAA